MTTTDKGPGFTPGPYHIIEHPAIHHRDRLIVDDAGDRIGMVRGEDVNTSIRDANAALWASAPDLYAALAEVVSRFDNNDATDALEAIDTVARAALALARGQEGGGE